jgi:TolB-like protein
VTARGRTPRVDITERSQASAESRREKTAGRVASVAVLPFVNLSADPENEFFADGITEDVITHLAKIKSLKVISRTSIMSFKKRDLVLRQIGERLGATTLLEGSVRRCGGRVRIVAQLIECASAEHLWAETYDRDLTDIFKIQSDVALKIANALRAELSHEERVRVGRRPTDDLAAYELYLRGRNWFHQFTEEGYRRSLVDYHAAVDRDPGFALAWASIAGAHAELCISGVVGTSPEENILLAKKAATRALDSSNGDVGKWFWLEEPHYFRLADNSSPRPNDLSAYHRKEEGTFRKFHAYRTGDGGRHSHGSRPIPAR